jgi:ankyrin repeat protein
MNSIDQELAYASVENNPLEVRRLLSAGANVNVNVNVNAKDNNDRTPLDWASQRGHVSTLRKRIGRTTPYFLDLLGQ